MGNLLESAPLIAAEWHPTKNGTLTPAEVSPSSSVKVWWLCDKGHEWNVSPLSRMNGGRQPTQCPFCTNRRVLEGFNDFASTDSLVAAEWHPTKNGDLRPSEITRGYSKKVWWLGKCGHEWETGVSTRLQKNGGCPACQNRLLIRGQNDVATTDPEIAATWHPTKNGDLRPEDVTRGFSKRVWWKGDCGHEFDNTVRVRIQRGCPICMHRRVLAGFNDLATTFPEIAATWHPTKNAPKLPTEVIAGSNKLFWWICERGHEWQTSPMKRQDTGCTVCSNRKVLLGYNDLPTSRPDVASEWHPTKNDHLSADQVTAGSNKRVWWLCDKGHEWRASIVARAGVKKSGCPVCIGRVAAAGFNDLATTDPEIASTWHPTKNGALRPTAVRRRAATRIWWLCESGHEWQSSLSNRATRGCPACAQKGFNPDKPSIFYLLENESFGARKIGITASDSTRLAQFQKSGWAVIHTETRPKGTAIIEAEIVVLDWIRNERKLPPYLGASEMGHTGGWSETFSLEALSAGEIIARMKTALFDAEHVTNSPEMSVS